MEKLKSKPGPDTAGIDLRHQDSPVMRKDICSSPVFTDLTECRKDILEKLVEVMLILAAAFAIGCCGLVFYMLIRVITKYLPVL